MTPHSAVNERVRPRYFLYLREAKRQSEASVATVAEALSRFETFAITPRATFDFLGSWDLISKRATVSLAVHGVVPDRSVRMRSFAITPPAR